MCLGIPVKIERIEKKSVRKECGNNRPRSQRTEERSIFKNIIRKHENCGYAGF